MNIHFVKDYLKDIDTEIGQHRQTIASLRLRITELEDMRVLIMQREDYRAERTGLQSPFGTIPNGGAIVMRDPEVKASVAAFEDGMMSRAMKEGLLPAPPPNDRLIDRPKKKRAIKLPYGTLRLKVLSVLEDVPEGMTVAEIGGFLGMASWGKNGDRKPLANCIHNLKMDGKITFSPDTPGGTGKRPAYVMTPAGHEALILLRAGVQRITPTPTNGAHPR